MIIFAPDDPLVVNGTYDLEGYQPGERARIAKAKARQREQERVMAKRKGPSKMDRKLSKPDTKPRPHGRQPRQPPLTGMEKARIRGLDDVAASIAETREQINTLRGEENEHLRAALKLMRKHNKTTWRAAGVELARVPGEEKLRVRTTKQAATAETEDDDERVEVEDVEEADGDVVDGPGEELRPGVEAEH